MTRDEIITAARKAGFETKLDMIWADIWEITPTLTRFAALVAAAEREACAHVCERRYMGDNNREDMEARRCAEAIRARGEK
jgi:hypothetical protein